MARTPANYSHNTQLSTSASSIVESVASNTKSIVGKLSFYNSGASSRVVTVYVVESSGTAGTANTVISRAIPADKTWSVSEVVGEVLTSGMSLQAKQDAGTDVNANCSGVDVT